MGDVLALRDTDAQRMRKLRSAILEIKDDAFRLAMLAQWEGESLAYAARVVLSGLG
jgi:hypothetical protein